MFICMSVKLFYRMVMDQEVNGHKILIIQCDCGHLHSNLIACARHKVIDEVVVPQSSSKQDKAEDTLLSSKETPFMDPQHSSKKTTAEEMQSLSKEVVSENIQSLDKETATEEIQSLNDEIVSEDTQSLVDIEAAPEDTQLPSEGFVFDEPHLLSEKNSEKAESKSDSDKNNKSTVHVVFIVQLPRKAGGTNFVGFQGGDWLSVHLDDLRPLKENELSFQNAIKCSISEIFNAMYQSVTCVSSQNELETASLSHIHFQSVTFNANRRLRDLIQMACSWLYDTEQNRERTTKRISILTDLIPTESTKG